MATAFTATALRGVPARASHGVVRARRVRPGRAFRGVLRAASGEPPAPEFGSATDSRLQQVSSDRGYSAPPPPEEPLGAKLEQWMKDPLSFMAMGPRAGLGALTAMPELMEKIPEIQAQMEEKVNMLVNDPRPVDEKQELLAKDLESALADFITKGEKTETDMLSQFAAQLPPEALDAIPAEVKAAFPGLKMSKDEDPFAGDWETTESTGDGYYTYSSSDSSPTTPEAADMVRLKDAASSLRSALEDIRSNDDPSKLPMLKVNLKDSRDSLARRVSELKGNEYSNTTVTSAVDEATALIAEVDALNL